MNLFRVYYLIGGLLLFLVSCKPAAHTAKQQARLEEQDPIIAYVGNEPIRRSEFLFVYEKNLAQDEAAYSEQSLREYLDLYVKFKLKVLYAREQGIDTTGQFLQEFETYKEQLAKPYLKDTRTIDSLAKQAYERMKTEVSASHILIAVPEDAAPADTLRAYERIEQIRREAVSGADFGVLASRHSDDPSAKTNRGYLGYFTALQMVYPFENMAYQTPVGEVSPVFRTKYGYHILKVHDKRPNSGKVQVAHIMLRVPKGISEKDSIALRNKVWDIYRRLQQGESWDELCKKYSEDQNTKSRGGELPPFTVGTTLPEFEAVAFSLQKPGDISEPFLTPYGWHIVKLIKRQELEPYEEVEELIKRRVARDSRSKVSEQALVRRLKRENNLKVNEKAYKQLRAYADSSLLQAHWAPVLPEKLLNELLISFEHPQVQEKLELTVKEFVDYVKRVQVPQAHMSPQMYLDALFERYTNEQALAFEKAHLSEKYPEYRHLLREYYEGMLLFQVMTDKVWTRAIEDTAGARRFFEQHRERYKYPERVEALVMASQDKKALQHAIDLLKAANGRYRIAEPYVITYAKGEATFARTHLTKIDQLVSLLLDDESMKIEVAGYQEKQEPAGLSKRRIEAVVQYLTQRGVTSTQIVQKDYMHYRNSRKVELQVFSTDPQNLAGLVDGVEVRSGAFEVGKEPVLDNVELKPGDYTFSKEGKHYFVRIIKVEPARLKDYKEARGEVINDYQKFLEEEWVKELQARYPVRIIEENLLALVKK
jgi:peptidyl-prolyl cis-trans isomerase SurA